MAAAASRNCGAASRSTSPDEAAAQIDAFVQSLLNEKGIERNELTNDSVFVRRIYLDIVGRIPTYQEVSDFEGADSENKRSLLIDALLDSPGYASHFYNYWEDVLRIKSRNRKTIMVSYQDWVKQSLADNKPYDAFVRELIASSGFVWDEPAVGYYLRDAGMPLDNMSNTAQVFLGTRMQCAQCHDHPFDRWTQQEYYHMAAFTFGVKSSTNGYRSIPEFEKFQEVARYIRRTEARANPGQGADLSKKRGSPAQRRVIRDIFEPLGTEVTIEDKALKLPDDYKYDDAKPNQTMRPKTPFGPAATVGKRDNAQDVYARWLTSPENPRFTKTIANRLWKKAMGVGLIEPVDDLKDDTEASNPDLMQYLEETMIAYDYDMKAYLRAIFNSRTYQSMANDEDPVLGEPYYFAGPALRRMSAEQLWDSVLALAIPNIDEKGGEDPQMMNLRVSEMEMKNHVANVRKLDGRELYAIVQRLGTMQDRYLELQKEYQTQLNAAGDNEARRKLRREFNEVRRAKNNAIETLLAKTAGTEAFDRDGMLAELRASDGEEEAEDAVGKNRVRPQARFRDNLVRASEVVSPAPPGHFLRQFGESDREIIESSSDEAAVPQALALLNGNLFNVVSGRASALMHQMQDADEDHRLDIVFKSFFAREPTDYERGLVRERVQANGSRKAYEQIVLALLNSQEFRFIQ